jgi:hypothetical protein
MPRGEGRGTCMPEGVHSWGGGGNECLKECVCI